MRESFVYCRVQMQESVLRGYVQSIIIYSLQPFHAQLPEILGVVVGHEVNHAQIGDV